MTPYQIFILIKLKYLNVFGEHHNTTKIFTFTYFFYEIQICFLLQTNKHFPNYKNHQHVLMLFLLINADSYHQYDNRNSIFDLDKFLWIYTLLK